MFLTKCSCSWSLVLLYIIDSLSIKSNFRNGTYITYFWESIKCMYFATNTPKITISHWLFLLGYVLFLSQRLVSIITATSLMMSMTRFVSKMLLLMLQKFRCFFVVDHRSERSETRTEQQGRKMNGKHCLVPRRTQEWSTLAQNKTRSSCSFFFSSHGCRAHLFLNYNVQLCCPRNQFALLRCVAKLILASKHFDSLSERWFWLQGALVPQGKKNKKKTNKKKPTVFDLLRVQVGHGWSKQTKLSEKNWINRILDSACRITHECDFRWSLN